MPDIIRQILISESLTLIMKDLKKHWCYREEFDWPDGNMYLTVDSYIEKNTMITGSNNITFGKV